MLIKNAKILIGKAFLEADIQFDETITAIGKIEGPADLDAQGDRKSTRLNSSH